ncbi:MAG: tetraacyldisaccharide 4'-kinase [Halofilum sp. (in: g-proteobacteria)]|nr:tetraacyldisaccharide 4'-kinase [Halofilum sp. (in: g-proteobacteria)]
MLDPHWLVRQWRAPTFAGQLLLRPVSWVFRLLVALRRCAYRVGLRRVVRLPVPVVVVGNLGVGGSGKTPLVLHLASALRAAGRRPGIVSRGHGGRDPTPRRIGPDAEPAEVGDEPALMARRSGCPVAVGADRPAAAALLLPDCNVILADDGLQHLALGRDLEIAVIDGDLDADNGRLLPAGPLREPRSRLQRVDLVAVRGGARPGAWSFDVRAGAPRRLVDDRPGPELEAWAGQAVHAVAGIGVPERFFSQLERAGLEVERHPFADHHPYRSDDLAFPGDAPILMTEKDAVKCRAFATDRMWYLPAEVADPDGLASAVIERLERGAH